MQWSHPVYFFLMETPTDQMKAICCFLLAFERVREGLTEGESECSVAAFLWCEVGHVCA